MNWARRISVAVLGCAIAVVILVGFVLAGLYRLSVAIDNQGDVLDGQTRAQVVAACTSQYAATGAAWDAEANRLFGVLVSTAATSAQGAEPDPAIVRGYTSAADNAAEMARRRLGLSELAVPSAVTFACPPLPSRLQVTPVNVSP